MSETIELIGLASIPTFLLLGLAVQQRRFTTTRWWRLRATVVSIATLALGILVTLSWGTLLEGVSLLDGSRLGLVGGAVAGILVYELIHYWYHRAAHRFEPLWRYAHQMHHSAESIDAFGANYLHPLDTVFWNTWPSLVFFPLLGLAPESGAIAGAFVTFNAMFQHASLRTPRWLGYIIQRPESHCVHHERGVHRSNYSDLPLWDIVFGTFENPASFDREAGFYDGASARIGEMLAGRDVSRPQGEPEETTARRPMAA